MQPYSPERRTALVLCGTGAQVSLWERLVELNGERVVGLRVVVGYLHTGFEKNMEQKTWWKAITYPARIDYLSFQQNELVFVLAIEKLLGIEPPAKATWMRMLLCELTRIHSHLIWLGTAALEIGAISMLWYCFRDRDAILDLFELVTGARMHTRYFQAGGLAEDIPPGFFTECRRFADVERGVAEAGDRRIGGESPRVLGVGRQVAQRVEHEQRVEREVEEVQGRHGGQGDVVAVDDLGHEPLDDVLGEADEQRRAGGWCSRSCGDEPPSQETDATPPALISTP